MHARLRFKLDGTSLARARRINEDGKSEFGGWGAREPLGSGGGPGRSLWCAYFDIIFDLFPRIPQRYATQRAPHGTLCRMPMLVANWCVKSDVVPDSRLQAPPIPSQSQRRRAAPPTPLPPPPPPPRPRPPTPSQTRPRPQRRAGTIGATFRAVPPPPLAGMTGSSSEKKTIPDSVSSLRSKMFTIG